MRSLFRKYPELYFALAALLLILKAFNIQPTSHTAWPPAILAMLLCCVMGAIGLRSKYMH
ncbi:MAG: hypothetical protein IPK50_09430 [Fibrobacterota bacterium]|nr:hypothetical protein [Fibrobacterota bacterium]QQS07099.1 MAG: hypothetical protein IPK50_09430 [Fibrobacterota bacterium]